ncbi:neurofilament medium polypeptide [Larimichthys crocea]|uniref:neurofilament medium polypeptide n=1 Tax=Larimichthys crocea TaxID=215358 RepID=UPI000F5E889E|nr:neurofilament medium polypeptide [Larimichthys crocea]
MSRRKSKKPPQDDVSILLDSSVPKSRRKRNSHASPALLFIIFTVGASVMGWFCVQQQQSLAQLSESCTTMQKRITSLQQVMVMTHAQTETDWDVEERIFALEEAQKQAQESAAVSLAASEKLMNSDIYLQLSDLHDEMDTRLVEIKQVSLSFTTLQDIFKSRSEEFEVFKESVVASLNSSSALVENVTGLTNAVASAYSRVDEQIASMDGLNARLEGHVSELNELKESMHLYNVALHTNNQKTAAVNGLEEAEQAVGAQALEVMLSSVQRSLDEQFLTSQTLHSSAMVQPQTFHTQDDPAAAEEFFSTTGQNATELQDKLKHVEEKAKQQDAEDEADEEAKEVEAMQEEEPLEAELEGEEEITPEEQEDEEITGQREPQTVDGHVMDIMESLEEEISEEVGEIVAEESAELNSEVFIDENEEDE